MRARAAVGGLPALSAAPPTITPGSNGAVSQIAGSVLVPWDSGQFFYTGEAAAAGAAYPDFMFAAFRTVSYSASARQSNHVEIEFITDAAVIEVFSKGLGSSSAMLFVVDGKMASNTPVQYPSDGGLYLTKVDFGSSAKRRVRILGNAPLFGGLRVAPGATVSAPEAPAFRAMFIGESITEGTAGQPAPFSFAPWAALRLGWTDAWVSGVGSTGYLAAPAPKLTFRQRFDVDVKAYRPDVLVIAGGINDTGFTDAQIQAEAGLLFDRIATDLRDTLVFVLGPWNPRTAIRAGINTAIKAAASGRPNFYWVPNYDDAWITGTGRVGAEMFDGNSDTMTSPDGTHPSPAGVDYYGQKVAESVLQLIA